jgi:hypothetical protein
VAATVSRKFETGGGEGGAVASRCGAVRAIEYVAHPAARIPTNGNQKRFMIAAPSRNLE